MSEPATITITRGPARGQLFELETELVPVSYTHLTLPTILLV